MAFKPNRELLNVNFEGYKLSSTPLDLAEEVLPCPVSAVQLNENEFSYQRVRAHTLHNHLHFDPASPSSVYWCGSDGAIRRVKLDGPSPFFSSSSCCAVLQLPPVATERATNVTMAFLNANVGVICGGGNEVALFGREVRDGRETWTVLKSLDVSEDDPVTVVAASLGATGTRADVLCAELGRPSIAAGASTAAAKDAVKNVVAYKWVRVNFKASPTLTPVSAEDLRGMTVLSTFASNSFALYAAFQHHLSAAQETQLLFLSETAPLLSSTTVRGAGASSSSSLVPPSSDVGGDKDNDSNQLLSEADAHRGLGYCGAVGEGEKGEEEEENHVWSQTEVDVSVSFRLPEDVTKGDVSCLVEPEELVVGLTDGTTLLRGRPLHAVDPEASNWTFQDHT